MTVRWTGGGSSGSLTIPEISHDMAEADYVFEGALDSGGKAEMESRAKKSLGAAMCKVFQAFPKVRMAPAIIPIWYQRSDTVVIGHRVNTRFFFFF
jgi:hypothetical protein